MGLDPLHRSRAATSCVAPRLPGEAGKVPGRSRAMGAHRCLLPILPASLETQAEGRARPTPDASSPVPCGL